MDGTACGMGMVGNLVGGSMAIGGLDVTWSLYFRGVTFLVAVQLACVPCIHDTLVDIA